MDEERALEKIREIVALIDEYGKIYDARWKGVAIGATRDDLHPRMLELADRVQQSARLAHDIAIAMGERGLAGSIAEHKNGLYGGHPWQRARKALVELAAILDQREELAKIVGPVGPQLSVQAMHPTIWNAAANLWDDGHPRQAVQTAGQALEGLLQIHAEDGLTGERLAALFSTSEPTPTSPRLRVRGIDIGTRLGVSVHDGAASLVRGAMAVRNLVSHPGWPDPSETEALEMLAVMSYIAHFVERCDVVTS